jgi:hypothetical protein
MKEEIEKKGNIFFFPRFLFRERARRRVAIYPRGFFKLRCLFAIISGSRFACVRRRELVVGKWILLSTKSATALLLCGKF